MNSQAEKFNPNIGGEQLSKTTSGAMFWTGIIAAIVLLPFLLYLAVQLANSGKENCEERVRPYRERNAELVQEKVVLERKIFRLDSINDVLRERDLLNKFNATEGPKQIILSPKKEAK